MVFNSLPLARALPSAYEVPAILSDCTALHLACQFGCHRVVKHLLGKAPKLLNLASMEGYTPLHILAMYNQVGQPGGGVGLTGASRLCGQQGKALQSSQPRSE